MSVDTQPHEDGKAELIEYDIDDEPPLQEAIPLGIQHLLAMFLSTVALPLVIAGAIGLSPGETAFIVQMALLVAGLATIVQVYSIGPIGARLPIVMGTSAIFVAPLIDIGNAFGLAAIFGAVIVAAPVEIVIGYFYDDLRRFFPPLVTGVVVMLVGLTLIPTAIDYSAGGPGAETYGNLENLALAGLVFAAAIGFNQYFDGLLSISSVLIAVVIGYIVAIPLGLLDLSGVAEAGWVAVPMPLEFGVEFHPSAILIAAFAYVVTSMETIGDVEGTTGTVGRQATNDEMRGALYADGFMSMFAGLFNAFPNTSFSQNVGLIGFTGVASKLVVGICGVFSWYSDSSRKSPRSSRRCPIPSSAGGRRLVRDDLLDRAPDRRQSGRSEPSEPDDRRRLGRPRRRRRSSAGCDRSVPRGRPGVARLRATRRRGHCARVERDPSG